MVIVPVIPIHRKRKTRGNVAAIVPLNLVSATFDPDGPEVYLTFDQEIDVSGVVVAAFAVVDGPDGHRLVGFESATLIGSMEISVLLQITGSASGEDVLLTVGAVNGIAGLAGGAWAGVSGLVLPFG